MGNSQIGGARVSEFYGADDWIEGRAEDQLYDVARWPGVAAVAGFPDLHPGRHGPVGAAMLADRLYPQLIGPDIGCGMALFALDLPRRKLKLDRAARRLRALEAPWDGAALLRAEGLGELSAFGLGTIGGGNHFCELQEVVSPGGGLASGDLCLLVHSGSRGLGAGVFQSLSDRWSEGFAADGAAGRDYLTRHDGAVAWAALNREAIATRAAEALRCDLTLICDAPHNLAESFGDGWLHRKGAARADRGIAPLAGSRDSASFLLAVDPPEGALASVSHGAGRRYDRASMHGRMRKGRADLAALTRTRFGGQVICEDRDLLLEEAGPAYKDPARVVASLEARGVARPVAELHPLLTYKVARA